MITTLLAFVALTAGTPDTVARVTPAPMCAEQTQSLFDVDTPAKYIEDSTVTPHPSRAIPNPQNLIQFVVDANGRVDQSTFLALRVNDSTLVAAAKSSLAKWHFTPATEGDCKVSQLVQTPVER